MDIATVFESSLPIIAGLSAFFIVYWVVPVVIAVSHQKRLYDDPSDTRKLHTEKIPNLGGIAIFCGAAVAFLLSGYATAGWVSYLVAGLVILLFWGSKMTFL